MTANICFISGHHFGLCALKGLLESEAYRSSSVRLPLLISLDEQKKTATVGFQSFSDVAQHYNIPHMCTRSLKKDKLMENIMAAKPDYLLIIGWSELAPAALLDIPRVINQGTERHAAAHGCIGMHPTLLPEGRGRAPIPWTLIKGLKETGVSAFLLEDEADAGGIIFQERIVVEESETAATLFEKCANAHYRLSMQIAPKLAKRALTWTAQDAARVTIWPKRTPQDGIIDFNNGTEFISRFVWALVSPYPGAFFYYQGRKIIVQQVKVQTKTIKEKINTISELSATGLPIVNAKDGTVECVSITSETELPKFLVGTMVNTES